MEEATKCAKGKLPYHGPEIVDVGTLTALTSGASSPATEAGVEITYYHSGNPLAEVDLGDQ
jgi:hypothetical protein